MWVGRYRQSGAKAVTQERSRRPQESPHASGEAVVEAVKAARLQRPDWGARKLAQVIAQQHPELPRIAVATLHRILDREGLIAPADRQRSATRRYERERPNELWQMDFKGPPGFNQGPGPLSILDDHSRYLLALRQTGNQKIGLVRETLEQTFAQCGLPEALLLDHGTPWYDCASVWGWTELTVWLLRQGIGIRFSGVRHPQTQGKVERMHGALQAAIRKRKAGPLQQSWLDEFRREYNEIRPHEGIGMVTPATRWQPSPRQFNPAPPDWQYPPDWLTQRLAQQGQLGYAGRRWEISRALRGQLVGIQTLSPTRVLVHFCNMAVRELDLKTGACVALPGNPFRMEWT